MGGRGLLFFPRAFHTLPSYLLRGGPFALESSCFHFDSFDSVNHFLNGEP